MGIWTCTTHMAVSCRDAAHVRYVVRVVLVDEKGDKEKQKRHKGHWLNARKLLNVMSSELNPNTQKQQLIEVTLSPDTGLKSSVQSMSDLLRKRYINIRFITSVYRYETPLGNEITMITCSNKRYLVKESVSEILALIRVGPYNQSYT